MNLSPEIVIVSGGKSTLITRPVFGEYYNTQDAGRINLAGGILFSILSLESSSNTLGGKYGMFFGRSAQNCHYLSKY
jgi:hypothetical protein